MRWRQICSGELGGKDEDRAGNLRHAMLAHLPGTPCCSRVPAPREAMAEAVTMECICSSPSVSGSCYIGKSFNDGHVVARRRRRSSARRRGSLGWSQTARGSGRGVRASWRAIARRALACRSVLGTSGCNNLGLRHLWGALLCDTCTLERCSRPSHKNVQAAADLIAASTRGA